MPNTEPDRYLHVAVGVVVNAAGDILIARRPDHLHQGGLWEFPGGKVEPEEHVTEALRRELAEELDVAADTAGMAPLVEVRHRYSDRAVLLDVWWVRAFRGQARGLEDQEVRWVDWRALREYPFPAANVAIVEAIVEALR